jgi:Arc/MetJ-type ribon-helix-helix transcriptional regulator
MNRSYPVSARISEDSKNYLEKLVEMGIAINTSEALKLCVRYAKQKKMEEEL